MAEGDNAFATRGAFDTVVATVVGVVAVAVFFEVREVVFSLVTHQVVERKAVVGGDEVDAAIGRSARVLIEIARAGQPRDRPGAPEGAWPGRVGSVQNATGFLDKGKPSARVGRKAMGPSGIARLPKG